MVDRGGVRATSASKRAPLHPATRVPADQDRTGLLQRLERIGQLQADAQREQLAELGRKIAAGEPVVLGPSSLYRCPFCSFAQQDAEFANGVTWRNEHTVPMAGHIAELHEANRKLVSIVGALEKRLRLLKAKRPIKRAKR